MGATLLNPFNSISSVIGFESMSLQIKWPTGHRVQQTINEFQQLKWSPGCHIDRSNIPVRSLTEAI